MDCPKLLVENTFSITCYYDLLGKTTKQDTSYRAALVRNGAAGKLLWFDR